MCKALTRRRNQVSHKCRFLRASFTTATAHALLSARARTPRAGRAQRIECSLAPTTPRCRGMAAHFYGSRSVLGSLASAPPPRARYAAHRTQGGRDASMPPIGPLGPRAGAPRRRCVAAAAPFPRARVRPAAPTKKKSSQAASRARAPRPLRSRLPRRRHQSRTTKGGAPHSGARAAPLSGRVSPLINGVHRRQPVAWLIDEEH